MFTKLRFQPLHKPQAVSTVIAIPHTDRRIVEQQNTKKIHRLRLALLLQQSDRELNLEVLGREKPNEKRVVNLLPSIATGSYCKLF